MKEIEEVLTCMVRSIVDSPDDIKIESSTSEKGTLYEISVSKDDVGKVIGKGGRIASAIRSVAKAAGAKNGIRVMVNVFNSPKE